MGYEHKVGTPRGNWGVRGFWLWALLFLTACTGSSSSIDGELSEDLTLTGSIGDGPIVGADIRVIDAEGEEILTGVSDGFANYELEIPDGTLLPATVHVSGGTDLVTGRPADFEMVAAVFTSGDVTVNVSPYTTLAVGVAQCAGSLTPDYIALAWDIIDDQLNLGWRRDIVADPVSDAVGENNITTILVGNEALGEVIRRTTAALNVTDAITTDEVLQLIACDLADGTLDGQGTDTEGAEVDSRAALTAIATAVSVRVEVIAGQLQVDGQDAMQRMDDAILTVLPEADVSVTSLTPGMPLIDQALDGLTALMTTEPDLLQVAFALDSATPDTARGQLLPLMSSPVADTLSGLGSQISLTDDATLDELAARQIASDDAPTPFLSLAADDASVVSGASTRLSWASADAESCLAFGAWSGEQPLSGTFNTSGLTEGTEFGLSCAGLGGVATERVFVAVTTPDPTPDPEPPAPEVPTVSIGADQTVVDAGQSATLNWSSTDAESCSASGAWSGSRSVSGSLQVGPLSSNATFNLTCSGPGGSASDSVSIVVNQPAPAPVVNLSAANGTVERGSATQLSWSSSNATSCNASGAWSGTRATSGSASTGQLEATSTFTLTCTGAGGTASDSATVNVTESPPPSLSFSAGATVIDQGDSTTLNWSAGNASACSASGAWSGNRAVSGSTTITPSADATYTLTCTGNGGSITRSVAIEVMPPPEAPLVSLALTSSAIDSGDATNLTWAATNANTCTASGGWSGSRATSGSLTVSPTDTTTYTLACTGDGGTDTASVVLTVNPPPAEPPVVSISLASSTIDSGDATTLSWSATNATTCTASGGWSGSKATSGSQSVSPDQTTSYTLTCTGDGGSDAGSVTLNVNALPPTLTFSASETLVDPGASVVLTWTSTNTTGCTASGGWSGARETSGSETAGPIDSSTTFSLTCTGSGGNAVEMLTVDTLNAVELTWVAPTENVDGTTLTDLAGYRIYWGTASRDYTDSVEINDPATLSHTLVLESGDYYVAMTALDADGNESAFSNEVLKTSQ